MSELLWVAVGLIGPICGGMAVSSLLLGNRLLARYWSELLGMGIVVGIGMTSLVQFAWSAAGGKLGFNCSLATSIGGVIAFFIAILIAFLRGRSSDVGKISVEPHGDQTDGRLAKVCVSLIGLIFVSAIVQTVLTPQRFWDERAYYGLKAIVLFEDQTINSSDLATPDFVQGHPRYPLLIPLAEQHLYSLMGHVNDRSSKILFPLLFAGLVLTAGSVLSRHGSPSFAWLGALLLATIPVLMPEDYGFLSGQTDAPVACFEGLAILYAWDALRRREAAVSSQRGDWLRSLLTAGVLSGLTAFTKDEGISFCAIHVIAIASALVLGYMLSALKWNDLPVRDNARTSSTRTFVASCLILSLVPAVMLYPWFQHRAHLPIREEMNYFGRMNLENLVAGLPTLNWAVPHLLRRMFWEVELWGLQWWLLALTLVLFPRRAFRPSQLFVLLTLSGSLAALLLAGMLAPIVVDEHISGSSHRYLMQLAPGVLWFAWGQMIPCRSETSPSSSSTSNGQVGKHQSDEPR